MDQPERSPGADASGARGRWTGRFLRELNALALLALIAAAAALFMSPRADDVLLGLPDLALGDRSPRTIRSPRALTITDPARTKALQEEAVRKVLPVYDQELRLLERAEVRVDAAFRAVATDAGAASNARAAFADALGVNLSKPDIAALITGPPDEIRDAVLSVLSRVGERPIVLRSRALPTDTDRFTLLHQPRNEGPMLETQIEVAKVLTIDQARAELDAVAAERLGHLSRPQRRAVVVLAKKLLEDNLFYNASETRRRQRIARASVKAVVIAIAPGEIVVKSGARVDEQKLRILDGMAAELEATSRAQVAAGSALLLILLVVFANGLLGRTYRPLPPPPRDLAFMATAVLLSLLTLWGGYHGAAHLIDFTPGLPVTTLRMGIPVAFSVLLVRLVAGPVRAALVAPVVAVLAGWMMDESLLMAIYTLAGSLAAASLAERERLTQTLFSATSRIIVSQTLVAATFDLRASRLDLFQASEYLAAATVSAVGSVVLAAVILALVEAIFGYATRLRLGQLANLNHPLLKQLLVEAPGTYHHSIMVGTMAEAAAEAIGADPILARVGGYYHDIGKLKNPRAFDENEPRDIGPADDPAQVTELRSHVDDGVELAVQHRLGVSVTDILRQHHGTGRVRRRRSVARPDGDGEAIVYAGPRPSGREAALVMLADNVEAAARNLEQEVMVDRSRIERAVADAVQVVLLDGQLDDCALTIRDLDAARRAFVSVLEGRLSRQGRPLSDLPEMTGSPLVRAPAGEPN